MSITMLIIGLVSGGLSLISFLLSHHEPTKTRQRVTYAVGVGLIVVAIVSVVLSYLASIGTEDQIQLAHDQGSEAIVRVDKAQAQIAEIRTPRRMEPATKRMLFARLKPYAGQKYDMKVFRDQDSLALASAIRAILETAGWAYTNVYPKHATRRYAETREHGVWVMTGNVETRMTAAARAALRGALSEAALHDDSAAFTPESCVESTGPIGVGTKLTRIPCSKSSVQIFEIGFTIRDEVIPADTLVLHVGKERP